MSSDSITSKSPTITIKKGDTIRWAGLWSGVNLTGYTLTCSIRSVAGVLLGTTTVTPANQSTNPGEFTIYRASTSDIPVGRHVMDLRILEPGADTYTTESWTLNVQAAVTAAP